jgi:hypothetical protein
MHRRTMIACALLAGFTAIALPRTGLSQDGWVTLIDGSQIGDWDRVNEANWRAEDGAVVADKKTGKDNAFLVTKTPYKDFMIRAEFWASDNANSGIFIRCQDPAKITATSCYEVNIYDQRKDPTYGTGAIVDVAKVDPMPKAGGKWNTFEITAKGDQMTVVMNGQKTAEGKSDKFSNGPFALQYADGVIKWRKVQVKPL